MVNIHILSPIFSHKSTHNVLLVLSGTIRSEYWSSRGLVQWAGMRFNKNIEEREVIKLKGHLVISRRPALSNLWECKQGYDQTKVADREHFAPLPSKHRKKSNNQIISFSLVTCAPLTQAWLTFVYPLLTLDTGNWTLKEKKQQWCDATE